MSFRVRVAGPSDAAVLLELIRELARYERLEAEVVGSAEALATHLAGPHPACEALLAEADPGGGALGFALFFPTYSTFLTRPGIHLEDLFVRPEWRGRGLGLLLFKAVARIAVERGAGRLEWAVLDWNAPAIAFYLRLGAAPLGDWTTYRLTGPALAALVP
jgi:GNAT superfamily N-acetyltransferase